MCTAERMAELEREKGRPLTSVEHGHMLDALRQNHPLEGCFSIDAEPIPEWPGSPDLLPSERMAGGLK